MKAYKLILMALVFAGIMVSCKDEDNYVPGPQSAGAFFPTTNKTTFDIDNDASSVHVTISRTDDSEAKSYQISASYPDDTDYYQFFNVPTNVSFAAGEKTAELLVSFDPAQIEFNTPYTITLSLPENEATEYGNSSYTFEVLKALTWEKLGDAMYTGDFVTTFYKVENVSYKVPIEECVQQPGKYRLKNPYGAAYPYNEPGDYDTSSDHYMVIDASNPDQVYIDLFESGMDWGNGEFIMWSYAGYMLSRGATPEEVEAEGVFGRMVNGTITFPVKSLLVAMSEYNDGGLYFANGNGAFCVQLPGTYSEKNYTSKVSYSGIFTDADGDNSYAVAKISVASDATTALGAVMATEDPDAVYDAIENQTIEVQAFAPGQSTTYNFPIKGAGIYTIGLVTYDGDEVVHRTATTFEIKGAGIVEQGDWEPLGNAVFVDGWMLPGFKAGGEPINPFDWAYNVAVEKDLEHDGVYRIASPYMGDVPMADMNENTKKTYLVFDCSDPDFVIFETQYSGLSMSGLFSNNVDPIYVGDLPTQFLENYSKEDIMAAGYQSTFSDGMIELIGPDFGPSIEECGYNWQEVDEYPVIVALPGYEAAPARLLPNWYKKATQIKKQNFKKTKRLNGRSTIVKKQKSAPVGKIVR